MASSTCPWAIPLITRHISSECHSTGDMACLPSPPPPPPPPCVLVSQLVDGWVQCHVMQEMTFVHTAGIYHCRRGLRDVGVTGFMKCCRSVFLHHNLALEEHFMTNSWEWESSGMIYSQSVTSHEGSQRLLNNHYFELISSHYA